TAETSPSLEGRRHPKLPVVLLAAIDRDRHPPPAVQLAGAAFHNEAPAVDQPLLGVHPVDPARFDMPQAPLVDTGIIPVPTHHVSSGSIAATSPLPAPKEADGDGAGAGSLEPFPHGLPLAFRIVPQEP